MRELLLVVNDPKYFLSHRLPIAEAAREKGYVVHVASIPGAASDRIKQLGFTYHELPLKRGGINPFAEFWSIFVFWKLLWELRPDILHLVTLKPVLYGGISARLAPVKGVVAAVAGMGSVFVASGLRYKLMRLVIRAMYRVALGKANLRGIFQNPDDRDSLIAFGALTNDKCILVRGSGVRLSDYELSPEPQGRVVVTFAGRLLRDKGVAEFVEAARLLKSWGVEAAFQLVGDLDPGNPSSFSEREFQDLCNGSDVSALGYREDIAEIFSMSNIVVLPSYREGLPKVLIEAAACGRAVVTTDVPGCRDAIEPGVSGLLVPVRDHIALANAIKKLIDDPVMRECMGKRGRELAEREFSIENVVQAHLSAYAMLEANS
ncbi:N,N'-diacetylbacillosaminyl-diphospho-undecaprenol alpha-1,3-N-acetylgalactosaminyltransferase [compost metagenome]